MIRVRFLMPGLLLAFCALPARAAEPLEATELGAFCLGDRVSASSDSRGLCEVYVLGFLDGAIATDGRVAQNVVAEIERAESLAERAVRTRGVARLLESFGETVYAEFCVGTPVPIAAVLEHVTQELESREHATEADARDIVYAALRRHYSCAREPD